MPAGRPTKFKPEYIEQAFVACSELGATVAQLAKLFKVERSTVNKWQAENQNFSDAVKKGRDIYDSGKVEKALLKRALGSSFTETTRERDSDGVMNVTKKVRKKIIPDTKAQIFWLKNRQPERWRDRQEVKIEDGNLARELEEARQRLKERGCDQEEQS